MGIELNNDQIYALYDLENWWNSQNEQVFEISGGPGTGKSQPDDTLIPTPTGYRRLKNIKVGDYVFGDDGNPTQVLGVYPQGKKRAYRVSFTDGRSTICCKNHLFTFYNTYEEKIETKELVEIMDMPNYKEYHFPISSPIRCFCKSKYDLQKIQYNLLYEKDYDETEVLFLSHNKKEKLIENILERSSIEELENYIVINGLERFTIFKLQRILYSMGIISEEGIDDSLVIYYNKSNGDEYNITYTNIESIEVLDYECDMRCIYVDNESHLYLTNDFIVTHNTTLVSYFIDRLGLKMKNVLFVAYMGKAASVLQRKGLPAKTIHSAIYDFKEKVARDPETKKIILRENGKPKMEKYFQKKYSLSKKIKLIVVDEASMVDTNVAKDLKSFGIPIVALGDLDQLPPVYGKPYFLETPNVVLTQIMRQAEGNPIVWLASQVREGKPLHYGRYGESAILRRKEINLGHFKDADIVITGTNRLRYNINNFFRQDILNIKRLDYPHLNEKVVCRKNNWNKSVGDVYMTNGTSGYVDHIERDSFNGNTMIMNFRADFLDIPFKRVKFDYNHMYAIPGAADNKITPKSYMYDKMEYGYAITCHTSQGSQYNNVTYLHEDFMSSEDNRKLIYTAITRAVDKVTIVM